MQTTTRFGFKKFELTDSPPDITVQNTNWDDLDTKLIDGNGTVASLKAGLLANRPAAGNINHYYIATDKGEIYRDTGSAWTLAGASSTQLGDVTQLLTTDKTSLVNALNELFQSASDGKTAIAAAVTGMGQSASSSETWSQLATKIGLISSDADAAVADVLTGKTFYQGGSKKTGTMANKAAYVNAVGVIGLLNMLTNSSFENGLTGWSGGAVSASYKVGNACAKIYSRDGGTTPDILAQPVSLVANHKYYGIGWFERASSLTGQGEFDLVKSDYSEELGNVALDNTNVGLSTWTQISYLVTAGATSDYFFRCHTKDTNGVWCDGLALIDLTAAFGAGSEPTKTQMDALLAVLIWFEGTTLINKAPSGAYLTNGLGGYPNLYANDVDMLAANIKTGKNIFGVEGALGAFPVGNPIYAYSFGTLSSWVTLLNYTSGGGWLVNASAVDAAPGYPRMRITLDGGTVVYVGQTSTYRADTFCGIIFPLKFDSSCKVEVFKSDSAYHPIFTATIIEDDGIGYNMGRATLAAQIASSSINTTEYTTVLDVIGQQGILLNFSGGNGVSSSYCTMKITIDGNVIFEGQVTQGSELLHSGILNLPYKSSAKVEAKSSSTAVQYLVMNWAGISA